MAAYIINFNSPFGSLYCATLKDADYVLRKAARCEWYIHSIIEVLPLEVYTVVYWHDNNVIDKEVLGYDLQNFMQLVSEDNGQVEWVIRAYAQNARTRVERSDRSGLVRRRRRRRRIL